MLETGPRRSPNVSLKASVVGDVPPAGSPSPPSPAPKMPLRCATGIVTPSATTRLPTPKTGTAGKSE